MNKQLQQAGFTIIEVMVAATISMILLLGVIQIFLGNKATYRLQEASANVQETGRFGMEFLTKDTRMIGFIGCANAKSITVTNNLNTSNQVTSDIQNSAGLFNGNNGLEGFTYTGGTLPTQLSNIGLTTGTGAATDVVAGTDVLYMQGARPCPGGDVVCHNNKQSGSNVNCPGGGNVSSAQYKIADNSQCQVKQNDVLLITDCVTADVHGVTNTVGTGTFQTVAHGANMNNNPPMLSNSYGQGSAIYKVIADAYYIGIGASGDPALYRRVLDAGAFTSEELVDGVYDMTILYGEDTDADAVANRYVTAADNPNWQNVINVRITLSTRSRQNNVLATASPAYSYNGASVTDRRLKRDFTSTITIRNRVK